MKAPETRFRWLALVLALMLVVAACGGDDDDAATTDAPETTAAPETTEPAKEAIRIPAINQQDGVVAWPEVTSATEAILAWYNAQGGIDGHPLELDLCTAGDDPESTQRCAQQWANDDDATFVYPMAIPNSAMNPTHAATLMLKPRKYISQTPPTSAKGIVNSTIRTSVRLLKWR